MFDLLKGAIKSQLIEKDFSEVMDLIQRKPKMVQWVENMIETYYKQTG